MIHIVNLFFRKILISTNYFVIRAFTNSTARAEWTWFVDINDGSVLFEFLTNLLLIMRFKID